MNLLSHLAQTFKTRRLGRFTYNPSLFIRTGSHEPLALRLSAHNQHAPGDTTGAPTALCVARLDSLPHLAMRMLLREGNAPMVLHARAFCILLGLHVCMRVCTRTRTRASFLTRRHTHGTLPTVYRMGWDPSPSAGGIAGDAGEARIRRTTSVRACLWAYYSAGARAESGWGLTESKGAALKP